MLNKFRFISFLSLAIAAPAFAQGDKPTTIEISTLRGQMKYSQEEFTVAPGAKVRLVLKNEDDMHHNLVICKPGKDIEQEVAKKAWELGVDGFAKQWIPQHPALLFASKMADPKKSVTLEFTAPKQPGTYPYVCTLPGHSMLMNGQMIVGEAGAAPTGSKNGLSELTFTLYKGSWDKLPNFEKLEPAGTDHVRGGLITLKAAGKLAENFALVFNGKLEVPSDGKYSFKLSSDDGSRLKIDGEQVIDHDGIHANSAKDGSVQLKKGMRDIEVQYFEKSGQEELALSWSGPGFKELALSESAPKRGGNNGKAPTGFPLSPGETEAIIYRNFIEGAGARAIGVGYPGSVNLAYDADQCRVALVWQGGFIDAARHWKGRGQGFQPPLGYNVTACVEGVPLAQLGSDDAPWPDNARKTSTRQQDNGYVFKGYRLDGAGRFPEFRYFFNGMAVTDLTVPTGSPLTNDSGLRRTISVRAKGTAPLDLFFRAATGSKIEKLADGRYAIDDKIRIGVSPGAVVRKSGGKSELLVPLKFTGEIATLTQTFAWH